MPKFTTKTGWLTQYALICGYAEVNQNWKDKRIATLWRDSACFHVQGWNNEETRTIWESFDLTSEGYKQAKELFMALLKQAGTKRKVNK